jgi:hypothetical protein
MGKYCDFEKNRSRYIDWSRDGAVGTTTGYVLATEGSEFESRKGKDFSSLRVIQTDSGAHPASYPMGTGGKAAEA